MRDGDGTPKGSPFATDGGLRTASVASDALTTLRVAKLLSASHGQMVSSVSLLLALGLGGAEAVLDTFLDHGTVGRTAAESFVHRPRALGLNDFSARSFKAVQTGFDIAGSRPFDDAHLLVGLLAQDGSTASEVLHRIGIDVDRLLAAARSRVERRTPGGRSG